MAQGTQAPKDISRKSKITQSVRVENERRKTGSHSAEEPVAFGSPPLARQNSLHRNDKLRVEHGKSRGTRKKCKQNPDNSAFALSGQNPDGKKGLLPCPREYGMRSGRWRLRTASGANP